jgi:hypothetical protein
LKAALISSIDTVRFTLKVISVNEPSGTRIPHPPILPSNSGNIFVNALAAPVVVGTIDLLHERDVNLCAVDRVNFGLLCRSE